MNLFDNGFKESKSVGAFTYANKTNDFDNIFLNCVQDLRSKGVNVMESVGDFIKNDEIMGQYKNILLGNLKNQCDVMKRVGNTSGVTVEAMIENGSAGDMIMEQGVLMEGAYPEINIVDSKPYGAVAGYYDQLSQLFDNTTESLVTEAEIGNLQPIKSIDYPILVKEFLRLASKDVMQAEVNVGPVVKKYMEQTWAYDKNNPVETRCKYPQCFYNGEYKKLLAASKGDPIKDTVVPLPAFKYNVIQNLTDSTNPRDRVTYDIKIVGGVVKNSKDEDVKFDFKRPMTLNLSDKQFINGNITQTVIATITEEDGSTTTESITVEDYIQASFDFITQTINISSSSQQITGVILEGKINNDTNEKGIEFEWTREQLEWKIDDGSKAQTSLSLETLTDHKVLLDYDLYTRSYNQISDFLTQQEDMDVFDYLDKDFEKHKGIVVDIDDRLGWGSWATERNFDFDSTSITVATPAQYIHEQLKFAIDSLLTKTSDASKLEDFTFVVYGNPTMIRMLSPEVKWVTRPGSTLNGVKVNYSYGVMTSGDIKVQVVSTLKVDGSYDLTEKRYPGLRIIPYPTTKENFTYKHYKYATNIVTNKDSAYRDSNMPGGSQTYIMGTSRYKTVSIQGIQTNLYYKNAEKYIDVLDIDEMESANI